MKPLVVLDCTPAMADVVSGAVPRPRERRKRENAFRWLVDTTAVWPRVLDHFGVADQWPGVKYRPDLRPPASLGLDAFPHVYALAWHKPPESRAVLLFVNEDGTRCAILDAYDEIARLWESVRQTSESARVRGAMGGRPRTETPAPGTIRSRKSRLKKK